MIRRKKVSGFPTQHRHRHMIQAFDQLAVNDILILEAMHDPTPFIEEFQHLRPGDQVEIDQNGPTQWIFRLIKLRNDHDKPMPLLF